MFGTKNLTLMMLPALLAGVACSTGNAGDGEIDSALREQLLGMVEEDAGLRSRVVAAESPDMERLRELQESEGRQTTQLNEIFDESGWPGVDMVGQDGADAAWTLLKHADTQTKQRALALIEESEDPGVAAAEIAFMTDEVLVALGEEQLFGTQFEMVHGGLVQLPLDNRDSVDARRARVGLPSLDEYLEMLEGAHGMSALGAGPQTSITAAPMDSSRSDR